jgi:serine/threonine protein kinase
VDALAGQTLGKRYTIAELIGSGSAADTYRALDARNDREVALKVLRDRPGDIANMQLAEARAIAALHHPKIVAIYDAGMEDGLPYIATELIRGRALRDLESGSLTYRQALSYLVDVLEALEYAHTHGVIHHDIRPSNILTTDDGASVKLADFGLSGRTPEAPRTTRTGRIVGTIAYLAPERFLSRPEDERADLYSIGVIMYELFTGTLPFRQDRNDLVATMFSHVHETPTPAREINRNLPEPLERVIMRAIDRDPDRRYQSAGELIIDLHHLLSPLQTVADCDTHTPRTARADAEAAPMDAEALAPGPSRGDALEAVLRGMIATRRRHYDEAHQAYLVALIELSSGGNEVEYARTALKYGAMLLQKASDGLRERSELRDGVARLNDALRIFQQLELNDQYGETESLINALERTAVGHN